MVLSISTTVLLMLTTRTLYFVELLATMLAPSFVMLHP
jgi:hypothetical protein